MARLERAASTTQNVSKPSAKPSRPSLALSGAPAVPLWNSFSLFVSGAAFVFWDLCGIEFCILNVLPTGFASNDGCILPQRTAQKLRRKNNEISPAQNSFRVSFKLLFVM